MTLNKLHTRTLGIHVRVADNISGVYICNLFNTRRFTRRCCILVRLCIHIPSAVINDDELSWPSWNDYIARCMARVNKKYKFYAKLVNFQRDVFPFDVKVQTVVIYRM